MEILPILSLIATVSTIFLFLTGIQICMKIRNQGNTKNITMFPFMTMCVSGIFWFKYGLLKGDQVVMFVNSWAIVLGSAYVIFYFWYATAKAYVYKMVGCGMLVVFPVLIYVKYGAQNPDTALSHLGLVCSVSAVILYGSPLISVSLVVNNKSTEYLSFPLCLANFLVSGMWFLYGRLVSDYVMQIPNFIGSMLGLIQVLLFAIYSNSRKYDMSGTGSII